MRIYEDIVDKLWFTARLIGDFMGIFFIIYRWFYHHQMTFVGPCIDGVCVFPSGDDLGKNRVIYHWHVTVFKKLGQETIIVSRNCSTQKI